MLLPSKCPSWEEDYNPISDSLNDSSCISQVRMVGSQKDTGLRRAPSPTLEDIHPGSTPVKWSALCFYPVFVLKADHVYLYPTDCLVAGEQTQGLTLHGLS